MKNTFCRKLCINLHPITHKIYISGPLKVTQMDLFHLWVHLTILCEYEWRWRRPWALLLVHTVWEVKSVMGGCLHDRLLTVGVFYSQQKQAIDDTLVSSRSNTASTERGGERGRDVRQFLSWTGSFQSESDAMNK